MKIFMKDLIKREIIDMSNEIFKHMEKLKGYKIMICHLSTQDDIFPILTLPGESLYMIKYSRAKDESLMLSDKQFLTPHGWGKRHISMPKIALNLKDNIFTLDDQSYEIRFGTSLRDRFKFCVNSKD